jgi:GLPGLI family protein
MKIQNQLSLLFLFFAYTFSFSQNIRVTYSYKPSEIYEFEENVFLNNNYKVSIVDSIPIKKNNLNRDAEVNIELDKKYKRYRTILIDNLKKNDTYFTYQIGNINYLVTDNPPEIKWNLRYKDTKKIGKYTCKKATAKFRGTDLEAWYTTDIPVSIAPYKFTGLPGLTLQISTLGFNNKIWVVKNIQFPFKGLPNYSAKYINSLKKIGIKDLVKKIDFEKDEELRIFQSKLDLPIPDKVEAIGNSRGMVEQKFEWE